MKGLKVTTLLAALVGLAIVAPAKAQTKPVGLSVEVGGDYVLDSDVRDVTGDWGWRAGIGYDLPTPSLLAPTTGGQPSVKLTYSENKGNGAKLTVWGVSYEERVPFSVAPTTKGFSPYWGLGLGVFFDKAEAEVEGEVTAMATASEDKTRVGGRALLGANFQNFYLEASYNLTGKVTDADTNSLGLVAGIRF